MDPSPARRHGPAFPEHAPAPSKGLGTNPPPFKDIIKKENRMRSPLTPILALAASGSIASAQAPLDFFILLSDGNVADGQILRINASGAVESVFQPGVPSPRGTAITPSGTFFVSVTGAGSPFVAGFNAFTGAPVSTIDSAAIGGGPLVPFDLEANADGDLFISNNAQGQILRVDAQTGSISVFADVAGTRGLGFAPDGRLFVSQAGGTISVVDLDGTVSLFADNASGLVDPFDVQVDSQGNIFVVNQLTPGSFDNGQVLQFTPDFNLAADGLAAVASEADVRGLAIDPSDNVFGSTAAGTIIEITNGDAVFVSGLNNPFAFDFVIIPAPGATALGLLGLALAARRRR